jgi:hypothetical protein
MNDFGSLLDATWFRIIAGLVSGLILGSFVTMLSYRLPRRLSIITPGSQCPACKTRLQPARSGATGVMGGAAWQVPLLRHIHWLALCPDRDLAALSAAAAFTVLGLTPLLLIALALIVALATAVVIRSER